MNTTIKNHIPQSFILSETAPNEEGIRTLFSQNKNDKFYTSLEEKNIKEKTSALEKSVEANSSSLGYANSENTRNNKEYLIQNKKIIENILNHSTSTVIFSNVSNNFVNVIQSYQLHYRIDRKEFDDELHFWVSPDYTKSKECMSYCLDIFNKFAILKDTIKEKFGITNPRELKRMMPNSYGINALITTGIGKWQEILSKGTDFKEDMEVRFVLLNLAKNFKNRHQSLFASMGIEDRNGQKFGLDTLKSSNDAWKDYKIVFA